MPTLRICMCALLAFSALFAGEPCAAPPTCTTHFFDWYVIENQDALTAKQKQWTYQVDWDRLGIAADEIGRTVHYYEVQCGRIREAGFDGIHYEWHGNPLKLQFSQALEKTGLAVAMFYDMQIRFHTRPDFITPTDEFADEFVRDVVSFYRPVPRELWLRDRNGRLPIIVYGYAFDRRVTDPRLWDRFYRTIISGIEDDLQEQVVFHWTNNGSPQQMYGFQHFPEIQSFIFNEASGQTLANAHSVTFVVHYDDLGVSFSRGGPRQRRWIRNDIRYLQEALWLAKHTNPDLVFNYGWNELYEGEHLLPDSLWGSWRYELAAAMVKEIKQTAKADLPRALVIVDDFLPALHTAQGPQATILDRQMQLLTRLRSLVPQARVVLPGRVLDVSEYDFIFSLNAAKDAAQEASLAECDRTVVYLNPDPTADTPMTRLFTDKPRQPLPRSERGPANEYVVVSRRLDVSLREFPFLEYRARNAPGTVFHIRYSGLNADGKVVQAWYESSPTDDRATGGEWQESKVNLAELAKRGAGEPVTRLRQLEIILDDTDKNGDFTLDLDYFRIIADDGRTGWADDFQTVDQWAVHASFEGAPGAGDRFGLAAQRENGNPFGRMTLQAVVSEGLPNGLDESTRMIVPLDRVGVLATADFEGKEVPLVLSQGKRTWLNTYSPDDPCWEALFSELAAATLNRGVLFRSYSHAVTAAGLSSKVNQAASIIQEEPLPVNKIRLVAPPELKEPLPHTLPTIHGQMRLRVIHGKRKKVPFPDPGSDPSTVTLHPGEVVEITAGP